jgi:hypothetical protein
MPPKKDKKPKRGRPVECSGRWLELYNKIGADTETMARACMLSGRQLRRYFKGAEPNNDVRKAWIMAVFKAYGVKNPWSDPDVLPKD